MRELMPVSGPWLSQRVCGIKASFEEKSGSLLLCQKGQASPTRPPAQPHSPLARRKWLKDQNVDC